MKRKKKKARKNRLGIMIKVFIFVLILLVAVLYVNKRVLPPVLKISEFQGINKATTTIDKAVNSTIEEMGITSSDFYIRSTQGSISNSTFSANTVLINKLCANIGERVLKEFEFEQNKIISLPLGVITGIEMFANSGPEVFNVSLKPKSNCIVDYETSFATAGINQVNFQVWINAKISVVVVNPLKESQVEVKRKIAVVNTVISGDVPYGVIPPYSYSN